ncbi:hypothetical protein [Sinomonas mesophila]|uniref:hypothetical protein n=1 Tax=Sinomonas mesophila TaxID=1531955 RepID=UPI003183509A
MAGTPANEPGPQGRAYRTGRSMVVAAAGSLGAAAGGVVAAAGGVVAAATLAAGVVMSPAPAPSARLDGVHEDLQRAVALHQITEEQAAFLEAQLAREILADDDGEDPDDGDGEPNAVAAPPSSAA